MRQLSITVLSAVDDVSRTGAAIDANQLVNASFHTYFGDVNAAGAVKIQASNDIYIASTGVTNRQQFVPSHWVDIPNATYTVVAGASGLIQLSNMAFGYIRVVFTSTNAGATTITCQMSAVSI